MPKLRSHYVCNQCGAESSQYFGKCPACNSWNALEEQAVSTTTVAARPGAARIGSRTSATQQLPAQPKAALTLAQISDHPQARLSSGYVELDRVLGGGIVPGSLVLIGGDPGIGKSTLLLQTANRMSQSYRTLYVCAEESAQQVKLRAQRLGVGEERGDQSAVSSQRSGSTQNSKLKTLPDTSHPSPLTPHSSPSNLYLLPETDLDTILAELESLKPHVAVIDSIQALYFSALSSAPGSVAQVRECTSVLMQMAKRQNITLFIVGHVTKEGAIAVLKCWNI
jgi:DNA repair protein RadA/Sms